jgi:hypothetical protein
MAPRQRRLTVTPDLVAKQAMVEIGWQVRGGW